MAPSRSPSRSRPLNHNHNALDDSGSLRKGGASKLSKSWSGSEIPKRSPFSKSASPVPSPPAFFEEKENEKDPNCPRQARTRHSATNPSKGMKSFMAPTISAASKITAASPRKKILAERNQVVRESTESSIVSAEGVKQEEEIRRKSEIGIGSEELSIQNMSRKLDFSSSKDHHQLVATHSHSHDIGILDADPSFPPYDPMKNYLSPRPRFLHYRPNPKIEQQDLLYAEDARLLEDSFSDSDDSGNAEDCTGTVEDFGTLMMTQEAQVSHETYVSKSKPRSIGRSKLTSFVLILTVVSFCIPIIDSPVLTPLKMKDQSFVGPQILPFKVLPQFYGYLDVASRNLQGLATRMGQWSINYIEILSSFGSFPKELGMSHSLNMTISSSSMVQSADLDFCYKSDFELADKKKMIIEQDDVDHMKIEFQLDMTDVEGLEGSDRDVAEKVKVELSDEEALADDRDVADFCYKSDFELANKKKMIIEQDDVDHKKIEFQLDETDVEGLEGSDRDVAEKVKVELSDEEALADDRDVAEKIKVEFSDEEDIFSKYEKRLRLYTELVVKFETMIKNEPEKIEIAKSVEALAGSDRYVAEKVKVGFSDEEDNFPKFEKRLSLYTEPVVKFEAMIKNEQPEKIEIAKSEEVYGGVYPVGFNVARKLEDQEALIELRKDHVGHISKEGIESSAYPLVGLQATHKKDLTFSGKKMMLAVLGMFATASMVFLFIKHKQSQQTFPSTGNKSRYKKTKLAPDVTNSCRHAANLYSHGGLAEMVSDSGPTEMSSSFKNSLHQSEMRLHLVTPSTEIMQRRESGVSSSVSYGSFTSFERRSRSAKKGFKEGEVITPVRRSSRIRNQISSLCI